MSGEITKSVVSGATWSGVSQVVGQGLKLVSGIILWRWLLPDDFGLLAMVAIVTVIAGNLIDVGFIEAVVQRKEITPKHLVSVFWLILFAGTALCLIITALSPLIAGFFDSPQLGPLLAVSSTIFIFQSSAAVHSALLRRRMQFFRASMADMGDAVGYIVAALTAAFLGMGVWSLVIGNIGGCVPGVVLRWILVGWRPSFSFSIAAIRDLWKFGINNVGTRLVYITLDKLDFLILGKYLLPEILGFYSQALKIVRIPSESLWTVGNRIGLPALSKVQDQQQRLQRGLLKGESYLSIIGVPIFVGMSIMAPELVMVMQGPQWIPSILPLRILCISGCIAVLNISIPAVFLARGRPDINLKLSVVQLVLLVPLLFLGVRYGAPGVAAVVSGVSVVTFMVRQKYVHEVIDLNFKSYLLSLRPAMLASIIMAAVVLAAHCSLTSLVQLPDLPLLVVEILIGSAVYISALKLGKNRAFSEIIALVAEMLRPYFKKIGDKIRNPARKETNSHPSNN
jgi:O-antigen/teichoic acid export membrane protein